MKLKTLFAALFATIIFIFTSGVQAADQPYQIVEPAQPTHSGDKIEVTEIFWYGCPHCYAFEPYVEKWLKNKPDDVVFRRVPGVLGRDWMAHARAYYTAEQLGILDQIHRPLFDAIHKDRRKIFTGEQLRDFFAEHGVDKDEFTKIFNSPEVTEKIKQAFIEGQNYKVTGVPTVIVNGKYRTSASMAGSYQKLIDVIKQLVDMERSNNTDKE